MNHPDYDHSEGVFIYSPIGDDYEPPAFPFWPFALCVGFPFVIALLVWGVMTLLKGT